MNIDIAVEILTDLLGEGPQFSPDDRREAIKLGIEAIEAWKEHREHHLPQYRWLLPGETEE